MPTLHVSRPKMVDSDVRHSTRRYRAVNTCVITVRLSSDTTSVKMRRIDVAVTHSRFRRFTILHRVVRKLDHSLNSCKEYLNVATFKISVLLLIKTEHCDIWNAFYTTSSYTVQKLLTIDKVQLFGPPGTGVYKMSRLYLLEIDACRAGCRRSSGSSGCIS